MNFAEPVSAWAARAPDRTAIVTAEAQLSYRRLDELTDAVARGLEGLGLRPGDAVAVMVPTGISSVLATLGVFKAGLVHVGVNVLFKAGEASHIVADSGAKAMIVDSGLLAVAAAVREEVAAPERLLVVGGADGEQAFEDLLETPGEGAATRALDPSAPAALVYSGGTTGLPKGALHDHANMTTQTRISSEYFGVRPDDRVLGVLPSFLVPPFCSGTWTALANGATLFLEPRFEAGRALDLILAERIDFMVGMKTMLFLLNELPARPDEDLSFMRALACGGMSQPPAVRREFEQRFGRPTLHLYGLSEGVNLVAGTPRGMPERERLRRFDSVGRPLAGIAVRILREDGSEAAPGEVGEICLGPARPGSWKPTLGYPGRPEETARALRDGWLHTNDLGHLDEEGYLYVGGRAQELIKVAGWSVFPGEIEALLQAEPEVARAAVVGVPDERSGEVPVAFVVPAPGSDPDPAALRDLAASRLAHFKRLRDVVLIDELPANLYGKVQKHRLRELYAEREEDRGGAGTGG